MAHAIVERRREKKFETTGELAEIVRRAVGPSAKDESDPATRSFQALRIAVNDELGELERGLAAAEQVLTTEATERNLSPELKSSVRPVFKSVLKGSTEESTVYQVVWHKDLEALTDVNMRSHKTIPGDEGSLLITYHNLKLRMDMGRPNLVIGRGEDCDLVVREKLASRKHLSIRLLRTHFYLLDHSLNGSFVTLESGDEVHVLRGELLLDGAGKISLGRSNREGGNEIISYARDRRSMYRV